MKIGETVPAQALKLAQVPWRCRCAWDPGIEGKSSVHRCPGEHRSSYGSRAVAVEPEGGTVTPNGAAFGSRKAGDSWGGAGQVLQGGSLIARVNAMVGGVTKGPRRNEGRSGIDQIMLGNCGLAQAPWLPC